MEKLTILRMFFFFPLIGLLIPDAGILYSNPQGNIPWVHMAIEAVSICCILACTAVMVYKKRHPDESESTGEASFL